jgi:hypothetical protein
MRRLFKTFLVVAVVVVILLVAGIVWFALTMNDAAIDAYAQWGAVDVVINYMETHDGQWPPNWEALQKASESNDGLMRQFGLCRNRVFFDFNADPRELRRQSLASDSVPFNVVHAHWYSGQMGDGPNAMLWRYFRQKAGIVDAVPPSSDSPASEKPQKARKPTPPPAP